MSQRLECLDLCPPSPLPRSAVAATRRRRRGVNSELILCMTLCQFLFGFLCDLNSLIFVLRLMDFLLLLAYIFW